MPETNQELVRSPTTGGSYSGKTIVRLQRHDDGRHQLRDRRA